ncbi:ATP-binding protein, partial [Candidatus Parcubacteria bacterium]|nr:ATP-binding protein [Candidatus Parcubacteria bacterium]
HSVKFPASFTLVAASNPCPCGIFGNPQKACRCLPSQIQKYQRKLSGPIIDRIDLLVQVANVEYEKLIEIEKETSEEVKKRVILAREIQRERFKKEKTNSQMEIPEIKKFCEVDERGNHLLKEAVDSGMISPRGYHRVLKVARTIADLEGKEKISFSHLAEALSYRIKEII